MGAVFRLLSAFLIFFLILGCGLIPLVWRSDPRKLSLANCLSAGFFLAGGMLHMLPEAHEAFVQLSSVHSTTAFMLCCCGIIGTFGIEKVVFLRDAPVNSSRSSAHVPLYEPEHAVECVDMPADQRHHETDDHHNHALQFAWLLDTSALGPKALVPLLLTIVLSVHSFIAGMALGVQESSAAALPTLIAIVAHKWVEAISLGVSVVRVTPDRRILLRVLVIFASMSPLGIFAGWALDALTTGHVQAVVSAGLTALASGTFVYVALVDVLIEEFSSSTDKRPKLACVCLGFVAMAAILNFSHVDAAAHART